MENNKLTKKYGLLTAICMVVGIVIGSGIFFKGQAILEHTKGNLWLSILAWAVGGIVMIICSAQFAVMATKYEKVNGVVDYAEATCGKRYAYYLGWFATTIYYPAMTSVLAWVSARYFGVLFGWHLASANVMALAGFFLIMSYVVNALSPKVAGYFQVSTTIIKLIPLILMAIVGVIAGLANGNLEQNFIGDAISQTAGGNELFAAVCATAFAYEGWIIATSINSEIKNSKKNLPIALVIGALIVVIIYILYNVAITGGAPTSAVIKDGATVAFYNLFGKVGGAILNVFIVISCLGTLNGLMLGCSRGLYSIAIRDEGPMPKLFSQVDSQTNMPSNSSIFALLVCGVWFIYFFGANLTDVSWFGAFSFDSSELPIITIYALYIPMLVLWIIKSKEEGVFKRFILPILAILSCLFLMLVAVVSHKISVVYYLIIFAVIMLIGFFFSADFKKLISKKK